MSAGVTAAISASRRSAAAGSPSTITASASAEALAVDRLALAQRGGQQLVLRLRQLGGGDRRVAEAGDLAPQRRLAGLGASGRSARIA